MKCRHCQAPLRDVFIDLGAAPPSNAFLRPEDLVRPELHFPLKVYTCAMCHLVQVDEVQRHDALFSDDYVYFSSYSRSWLAHARAYVEQATQRLGLGPQSLVMEVASNDGYLLQYVQERGIPCVGVEPTAGTADVARARGIETIGEFFGVSFARRFAAERRRADLVLGNNVLAHVPDINDFVAGLREVLAPHGSVTVEFPHLLQLVQQCQFDTIYHEHFSYLSFHTVQRIFAAHGLTVWDVETLSTHGGSLRVWAQHSGHARPAEASVAAMLQCESDAGMMQPGFYQGLQAEADRIKNDLLAFLIEQKRAGRRVAAYGAAAKGNTLLNYAGVRPDLLPYVVDASPHKQGRFLPGSRIPVVDESHLREHRPDVVLILPWNLRAEIVAQLDYLRAWGGRVATAVPRLQLT
ncbi:class I SAM-dependent methyltransferase [Aquabacterium sp. A7-Y]|uniref:class I SAM-dependent methyltransferase n=1 Tax=Aquabacterium sp. A7-Y TaxID=1349605 RepID=UPI00223D80DC|nr:class I SAM-dependent methyltransferase [Aquabacterium sp. A7-Y]MCW7540532.1 class I SAM-dependent methyltransferase [Aquabacterium sp. A7-Y]